MHLIGTSVAFWFSTIIEEALDDYIVKMAQTNSTDGIVLQDTVEHQIQCANVALLSSNSLEALPMLYPFQVEYNITLASVWYIIWSNIGLKSVHADPHHMKSNVSRNNHGVEDINYQSNFSISADCHASNRGLFGGLSTLLFTLITVVIFFTTINQKLYYDIGVMMYTAQLGLLTTLALFSIPFAYLQTRQLNIVERHHADNASTAMDDFLLLLPLPFYFIHYMLAFMAEARHGHGNQSYILLIIYIFSILQVRFFIQNV